MNILPLIWHFSILRLEILLRIQRKRRWWNDHHQWVQMFKCKTNQILWGIWSSVVCHSPWIETGLHFKISLIAFNSWFIYQISCHYSWEVMWKEEMKHQLGLQIRYVGFSLTSQWVISSQIGRGRERIFNWSSHNSNWYVSQFKLRSTPV